MALPRYWLSMNRKDLAERAIIAQRNKEVQQAEKNESTARYYRELEFISSQYKNLEEQPIGKISKINEESRIIEEAKAKRREKLDLRRERLANLLAKENETYMAEVKAMEEIEQEKDPWNISKLKDQIEELRQRREREEEELRKKNMHHLYHQTNIPYVKEHVDSLHENEVKQVIEKKKKDIEKHTLEQAEEDKRMLEELEKLHKQALQDLETAEKEKVATTKQYEDLMRVQMSDIEKNNIEHTKMTADVEALKNYFNLINGIESKRRQVQEIQAQKEKQISQFRPSKEKVRKMSAEVKHRLELDVACLNYLSELECKQRDLVDASLAMNVVASTKDLTMLQIAEENLREAEIQTMFEEEATAVWGRRKREWDTEKEAHQENMNKIFKNLKLQLEDKINTLYRNQREMLIAREKLLYSLEENNKKLKGELRILTDKIEYFQNRVRELTEKLNRVRSIMKKPPQLPKGIPI